MKLRKNSYALACREVTSPYFQDAFTCDMSGPVPGCGQADGVDQRAGTDATEAWCTHTHILCVCVCVRGQEVERGASSPLTFNTDSSYFNRQALSQFISVTRSTLDTHTSRTLLERTLVTAAIGLLSLHPRAAAWGFPVPASGAVAFRRWRRSRSPLRPSIDSARSRACNMNPAPHLHTSPSRRHHTGSVTARCSSLDCASAAREARRHLCRCHCRRERRRRSRRPYPPRPAAA